MFCQKCGNEVYEADLFCANCGAKIHKNISSSNKIRNEGVSKSNKKKVIIAIGVVVIVLVAALTMVLGDNEIEKAEPTETVTTTEATTELVQKEAYQTSIDELLTNDRLHDKRITVEGYVNGAGADCWLETPADDIFIYLYNESDDYTIFTDHMGTYCKITGTFYYDDLGDPAILVEEIL